MPPITAIPSAGLLPSSASSSTFENMSMLAWMKLLGALTIFCIFFGAIYVCCCSERNLCGLCRGIWNYVMLVGNYAQMNDRYHYRKLHKDGQLFNYRYDRNSREEGIEPDLLPHFQYFDSLAARKIKLKYFGISTDEWESSKNANKKKKKPTPNVQKPLPKTTKTFAVINPMHVFARKHNVGSRIEEGEDETEMESLLGESFRGNFNRQKKYHVGHVRSPSLPIIFESPKPIQHSTPNMFSPIGPPMHQAWPDLVSCTFKSANTNEKSAYDGLDTGDSYFDRSVIDPKVNDFLKFFLNFLFSRRVTKRFSKNRLPSAPSRRPLMTIASRSTCRQKQQSRLLSSSSSSSHHL